MAYEADRVVVELIANVEGFDARVKQSATSFDSNMNKITASAVKAEQAVGKSSDAKIAAIQRESAQIRQFSAALARDMDFAGAHLTSPNSPFVVPVKQAPAVSSAMRLVSTGATILGGVLGGVVVTGTLAAAAALLELVRGSKSTSAQIDELVEKLKEHAEKAKLAALAQQAYERTIEGSIAKVDEMTEALKKQNLTLEDTINLSKAAAAAALGNIQTNIAKVSADLTTAVLAYSNAKDAFAQADSGANAGSSTEAATNILNAKRELDAAESRVRSLSQQLDALSAASQRGATALEAVNFPLVEARAKEAFDPIAKINRQYDEMAKKAKAAGTYTQALADSIERLREADLKAARASGRDPGELTKFQLPVQGAFTGRLGEQRPGHRHAGLDIAVPKGTAVQAPAGGVVIEAGTLPGYGNVVFIDHGGGTISRLAHLSQIGVKRGQELSAGDVIGLSGGVRGDAGSGNSQGPHVHYEVRVGGRAVNPLKGQFTTDAAGSAVKAEQAREREADRARNNEEQFERVLADANARLLRAKRETVINADEIVALTLQQIEAERAQKDAAADALLADGKIDAAKARQLKIANGITESYEKQALEASLLVQRLQEEDRAAEQSAQFRTDALRYEDDNARTQDEHRRVQLEILDIVYAEREAHLERLKMIAEGNKQFAQADLIQQQIDNLPAERSRDVRNVNRGTMDPLEAWKESLPQTAAEINEALHSIEAEGLESLAGAIGEVVMGTKSLGEAFGDVARQIIADIIRMTIRMLIFKAISAAFGGPSSDPFTLTSSPLPVNDTPIDFGNIQFAASGGPVHANQPYIVGEQGPELFIPGRAGMILPNAAVSPMNDRAASPYTGSQSTVFVAIEASEYFDGRVLKVTGPVIAQTSMRAAQGGAAMAHENLARRQLHSLG